MRVLFGLLLVVCISLFAVIQWGGELVGDSNNGVALGDLNPEKIVLLDRPAMQDTPVSEKLSVATSAPQVSAPLAVVTVAASAVQETVKQAIPTPASAVIAAPTIKLNNISKVCLEWGEFSGTDLALAEKSLDAMALGEKLTKRTVEYDSGHWVYIPPLKNKAAVNKKISELKALGIEEYFVVQEAGKWKNAISLGVFKTKEAAKAFFDTLRKKGVRTMKMGERKHKLKFIVFGLKEQSPESVAQLKKLQKDFENSELKTIPCNK